MSTIDQAVQRFSNRVKEIWDVRELAESALSLVVEPTALDKLLENRPADDAPAKEWQAYAQFVAFETPEGFQISRPEDKSVVSMAEGTHRIAILYNHCILPGRVESFDIEVDADIVSPESLGRLTVERAAGKQNALPYRMMHTLNWAFPHMLDRLGFNSSNFDTENYGFLAQVMHRLKQKEEGLITEDTRAQVEKGFFAELAWPAGEGYFSGDITSFEQQLQQYFSIRGQPSPNDWSSLGTFANQLPEGDVRDVYNESMRHFSFDGFRSRMGRDSKAGLGQYIAKSLSTAVRRALFQRIVDRLEYEVLEWVERGVATHNSIAGYAAVMDRIGKGARESGVPVKDLIEIIGGKRFGSDPRASSPIDECYGSFTGFPEPARTRLVTHVLETTGYRRGKEGRRMLASKIKAAYEARREELSVDDFVGEVTQRNIAQMCTFSTFAAASQFDYSGVVRAANHVADLLEGGGIAKDVKTMFSLSDRVIGREASMAGDGNKLSDGLMDINSFDTLVTQYTEDLEVHRAQSDPQRPLNGGRQANSDYQEGQRGAPLDDYFVAALTQTLAFPKDRDTGDHRDSLMPYARWVAILDHCEEHLSPAKKYGKGTPITSQGEVPESIFLVKSGELRMVRDSVEGNSIELERYGPYRQSLLGLEAALGYNSPGNTVVMTAGTQLHAISPTNFNYLLNKHQSFRDAVRHVETRQRLETQMRLNSQTFESVEGRVAEYLLTQAYLVKSRMMRMTKQDIATGVGCSREMVGRFIGGWEDHDGLLLVAGKTITIIDPHGLAAKAGYDIPKPS